MTYASTTKVPVTQTRIDIERQLGKHGAEAFGFSQDGDQAIIAFRLKGLSYRFILKCPEDGQALRAKWRALLLVIKARLEGVEVGIETYEEAFLANTVVQGGGTIWERAKAEITEAKRLGKTPRALALTGPA